MPRIVRLLLCCMHLSFGFFLAPNTLFLKSHLELTRGSNSNNNNNDNEAEEEYILPVVVPSQQHDDAAAGSKNRLDADLLPAPINIRKESILFGENPATMDNNNILRVWKALKQGLPFIVTGARTPTTADDNPLGAIYNVIFVRVPVIVAGLMYGKNLTEGHPLIVDFGKGSFVMSPLVVLAVLFVILR